MRLRFFKKIPTTGINLFQKLILVFLIAITPVFIVSALINRSGEAAISGEITNSLKSNAHFYLNTFELEMERVIRMKQKYILDSSVQNLMRYHTIYSDSDVIYAKQDIERRLQQFKDSSLFVHKIKLMLTDLETTIHNDLIEQQVEEADVEALQGLYLSRKHIGSDQDELIMGEHYPKKEMQEGTPKIWMEIILSKTNMERSLREVATYNGGEALIVDQEGKWLLGSLPQEGMNNAELLRLLQLGKAEEDASGIGRFMIDGIAYVFAYESSSLLDATLVAYVPENSFLGPIKWYKRIYFILAATSLLVIIFFSTWIYSLIHKPMIRLTGAFRRLEKGVFNTLLESDRKDEFNYLYQQFNKMSGRLEGLINDVYEHELRLNRAELKQLQAQINPHFLYNIFFLLNRIIQLDDIENAKRLTKYLGQFFRFITRNKEDEALLKEEMSHIEAYIGIQSLRFGNKLAVQIEPLPAAVEQLIVPRLILQPIVENAFEYGLEDHHEQGILRIWFELVEEELLIHIEDNGIGLTEATVESLQQLLLSQGRDIETTGILNIHRRVQLKFGQAYGLTIGRSKDGGLHVMLRLPIHSS